jgi:hypothetical protein
VSETQAKSDLHDVFDQIINAGPHPASDKAAAAGDDAAPSSAVPATATAPTPAHQSAPPVVAVPVKAGASVKLVAPGTRAVGPRHAGANACEAIHADKTNLLTSNRRTSLRGSFLTQAVLFEASKSGDSKNELKVSDLVLTGLRFLSPVPLKPGTVRQLRTTGADDAKLASSIRVVSTKVRPDGQFDVTAEFY